MCNAVSKSLFLAAVAAVGLSLTGCGKADPEKAAAEGLVAQAEAFINSGEYDRALSLLDSLDCSYRGQLDARRKGTALRPRAQEQAILVRIAEADRMIAENAAIADSLAPKMKHVSGGDLEGYYVVADAYDPAFINKTGVEARVNDADHRFYLVAQSRSKAIGLNQVAVNTASDQVATSALPAESARRISLEGSEMATFLPEESDTIGRWASDHPGIKGATLLGTKGNVSVMLSAAQADAIATAWRFATAKRMHRQALILREKLDRQLQTARDHIANTTPIPEEQ